MLAHQLGRRNLSTEQIRLLQGTRYNLEKQAVGGTGANQHTVEQLPQNDTFQRI